MRGGAIPLLAWGMLLLVLLVLNWVWTGDAIQVASFGFAVLAIWGFGVSFFVINRQSIRRGPPEPHTEPDVVPDLSLSAVVVALSVATILFGFVWAHFLVFFGGGMLLLSLGRLVLELRVQRKSFDAARAGDFAHTGSAPEEGGVVATGGRAGGEPAADPALREGQQV